MGFKCGFNWLFWSKFVFRICIVMIKSIKTNPNFIENFYSTQKCLNLIECYIQLSDILQSLLDVKISLRGGTIRLVQLSIKNMDDYCTWGTIPFPLFRYFPGPVRQIDTRGRGFVLCILNQTVEFVVGAMTSLMDDPLPCRSSYGHDPKTSSLAPDLVLPNSWKKVEICFIAHVLRLQSTFSLSFS